jgi:hypothetical protein
MLLEEAAGNGLHGHGIHPRGHELGAPAGQSPKAASGPRGVPEAARFFLEALPGRAEGCGNRSGDRLLDGGEGTFQSSEFGSLLEGLGRIQRPGQHEEDEKQARDGCPGAGIKVATQHELPPLVARAHQCDRVTPCHRW